MLQITKELKAHAEKRHGYTGDNIESCYILGCAGCSEKFDMDGEIRDWDDHMAEQPCKRGRPTKRSR